MSRFSSHSSASVFAAVAVVLSTASAGAQDAYTTRIEPRPVYGATVTVEHGVRVTRPLPPVRHVIINPGNQTPVNLGTYDYYGDWHNHLPR